jgi:hypothetical protein
MGELDVFTRTISAADRDARLTRESLEAQRTVLLRNTARSEQEQKQLEETRSALDQLRTTEQTRDQQQRQQRYAELKSQEGLLPQQNLRERQRFNNQGIYLLKLGQPQPPELPSPELQKELNDRQEVASELQTGLGKIAHAKLDIGLKASKDSYDKGLHECYEKRMAAEGFNIQEASGGGITGWVKREAKKRSEPKCIQDELDAGKDLLDIGAEEYAREKAGVSKKYPGLKFGMYENGKGFFIPEKDLSKHAFRETHSPQAADVNLLQEMGFEQDRGATVGGKYQGMGLPLALKCSSPKEAGEMCGKLEALGFKPYQPNPESSTIKLRLSASCFEKFQKEYGEDRANKEAFGELSTTDLDRAFKTRDGVDKRHHKDAGEQGVDSWDRQLGVIRDWLSQEGINIGEADADPIAPPGQPQQGGKGIGG